MDKTLRELQSSLPWTAHYHRDFRNSPMTHKDFGHALLHVHKAGGKLASVIDEAEHAGHDFDHDEIAKYVADLVICALRMANTCPNGIIDLQRIVEDRIVGKNQKLAEAAFDLERAEKYDKEKVAARLFNNAFSIPSTDLPTDGRCKALRSGRADGVDRCIRMPDHKEDHEYHPFCSQQDLALLAQYKVS